MPELRFRTDNTLGQHSTDIRDLKRKLRQANKMASMASENADTCAALQVSIATEIAARINSDTFLSAALTSEQSARGAADTTNASAIASEATARALADTSETNARVAADNAEVAARNTAIAAAIASEVTARNTAVNTKAGRYAATFGNGVLTSFTFTHGLGTADVIVQVYAVSGGGLITPLSVSRTATTVTVTFLAAISTNGNRIVIIG